MPDLDMPRIVRNRLQVTGVPREDNDVVRLGDLEALYELLGTLQSQIAAAMPVAPADGKLYVASGNRWVEHTADAVVVESPFAVDPAGYVVIAGRDTYQENPIWIADDNYFVLSPASVPGDTDGLFVIDDANYAVFARSPSGPGTGDRIDPFVLDAGDYAVLQDKPSYSPNSVWSPEEDYIVLSGTAAPGDADSMFVVDADGYGVLSK